MGEERAAGYFSVVVMTYGALLEGHLQSITQVLLLQCPQKDKTLLSPLYRCHGVGVHGEVIIHMHSKEPED